MVRKNGKIGLLLAGLFLMFLISPVTAKAAIINVPGDYTKIQAAINAASVGDTVQVAAGTYSPSTNGEVFPINMKHGVSLVGAGADSTILDAEGTGRVIHCYQLGTDRDETIDGFTITNGSAYYGSGIYIEVNSKPTIKNCIITGNGGWGMGYGAGVSCYATGSPQPGPMFINCTITDNMTFSGGGFECFSSSPLIINCTIADNTGLYDGGGMFLTFAHPELVNTILRGNNSWFGPSDVDYDSRWPSSLTLNYCDINPLYIYIAYTGSDNINADPLFVGGGDYHLSELSPCIDVGTADATTYPSLPGDDIDGDARPSGAGYDIGSDEYFVEVENNPPTANAGDDITITEDDVDATTIQGLASDPDAGDVLQYRWLEGAVELLDWQDVVVEGGLCPLALSGLGLGVGEHTLTLEVKDAEFTNSDDMILTIEEVNHPPVANAGDNIQILSEDQAYTIIEGTASDEDGDELEYRWLEGATVLADWSLVGTLGEAYLDLAGVPYFSVGDHVLTLEVRETSTPEQLTASDTMTLTIENSPPTVNAQPDTQTVEIGVDPILIQGQVSDFDGDTVSYEWLLGSESLGSGIVVTVQGGTPVSIPDLYIEAGDTRFPLGDHLIDLVVDDGINASVSDRVKVMVQDTTGPSLGPVTCPPMGILWPPNHKLVPVTICANAFDNDVGGEITLDVRVESSEPPDADADGNTIPDIYIDSVNWDPQTGGTIELRLRSERQGTGSGRIYTIYITAMDASGNSSTEASLTVLAPHDKRKN